MYYVCVVVCVHACICVCVCLVVCMCACMHVCVVCMCVYVCIHVCVCLYACMYGCVYMLNTIKRNINSALWKPHKVHPMGVSIHSWTSFVNNFAPKFTLTYPQTHTSTYCGPCMHFCTHSKLSSNLCMWKKNINPILALGSKHLFINIFCEKFFHPKSI